MTHFNRPLTHTGNRIESIANVYRAAGLDFNPPGQAFIQPSTDTPESVLNAAAQEAVNPTDNGDNYADFVDKYTRASIAEQFRLDIQGRIKTAIDSNVPAIVNRAVEDVTPAFNTEAAKLTKAAQKLNSAAPLDPAQAIADDSSKEYKAAVEALRNLGAFAGLWVSPVGNGSVPAPLMGVLGLVRLPENVTQEVRQDLGTSDGRTVNNTDAMATTNTVRQFTQDIQANADEALIGLARGDYEGMSLELANPTEYNRRYEEAATAHSFVSKVYAQPAGKATTGTMIL